MIKHGAPADADGSPDGLSYDGNLIRRCGSLFDLTSMWHATGRPLHCRPNDWLARPETQRVILHLRNAPPATPAAMLADIAGLRYIRHIDADFLLVTVRGRRRGTWAHWQIALAYAQYLSPPFHAWCHAVIRGSPKRSGDPCAASVTLTPVMGYLEHQFAGMHHRFDIIDRHAGDLMFLATAGQELMLGNRLRFSDRSQLIIREAVALQPFDGRCPSCGRTNVLSKGKHVIRAQYDHFFHRALNRPEHGWLVCGQCHDDFNRGGYLMRFSKMPEFRRFQAAVLTVIQAQSRSAK